MTFSEPEIKRWETLIAEFLERRRPPPHLRKDVDLSFRIERRSIEIFEIRSHWTGKGKPTEHRIAKGDVHEMQTELEGLAGESRFKMAKLRASPRSSDH